MLRSGSRVKMSKALKAVLVKNGCKDHLDEFGDCIGIVIGQVNFGNCIGPEWDVRWQPKNLRYAYDAKYLVVI